MNGCVCFADADTKLKILEDRPKLVVANETGERKEVLEGLGPIL
jgi:hypothetical protein